MIFNEPKELTWQQVLFVAFVVISLIGLIMYAEDSQNELYPVNEHVAEIPIDNLK